MTDFEQTGWRDQTLSQRRRRWGRDLPAQDIDDIWCEYDCHEPVALVEYFRATVNDKASTLRVLRRLAAPRAVELPAFAVRYWPPQPAAPDLRFRVTAVNEAAEQLAELPAYLTEIEFAEFEYSIRHRIMPDVLRSWLREHVALDR